jgi:hypothetical protein
MLKENKGRAPIQKIGDVDEFYNLLPISQGARAHAARRHE